jgi:hypothetical protein
MTFLQHYTYHIFRNLQNEFTTHFAELALRYAVDKNGRDTIVEKLLLNYKNSFYLYLYAKHCIKGRWLEAEPVIKESPYNYGKYIDTLRYIGIIGSDEHV